MATKPETNIEFMQHIMQFSKYGALMQAFILSGLQNYAKAVIDAPDSDFENSCVDPTAWKGTAQEFLTKLEEFQKGGYADVDG